MNPVGNLGIMNTPYGGNVYDTNSALNMIKYSLLGKMTFDNPIIDGFTLLFLLTVCSIVVENYIPKLMKFINRNVEKIYNYCVDYIITSKSIFFKEKVKFKKTTSIEYITDKKELNTLYLALEYYINNNKKLNIDYNKENELSLYYTEQISEYRSPENITDIHISKKIKNNHNKEIVWRNHTISYNLSNDIITIYNSMEPKKKENYKIELSVYLSKDEPNPLEDFCKEAIIEYAKSINNNLLQRHIFINKENKWIKKLFKNNRNIKSIILADNLKDLIVKTCDYFVNNEKTYFDKGIPYNMNITFYGPAGTGKTSIAMAIAEKYNRSIYFPNFDNINSDTELYELFENIDYSKNIIFLEDLDRFFEKMNNNKLIAESVAINKGNITDSNVINNGCKISKEALLNFFDGAFANHGRIMFITANKPEFFDTDKTFSRPGRLGNRFFINYANKDQIAKIYELYFDKPLDPKHIEHIEDYKYPPALFTDLFIRNSNDQLAIDHPEIMFKDFENGEKFQENIYFSQKISDYANVVTKINNKSKQNNNIQLQAILS